MAFQQQTRQGRDIFRLGPVEADGLDVIGDTFLTECDHGLRRRVFADKGRVARFTPLSVACAESTTATSN